MRVDFFATLWGNEHLRVEEFLENAVREGFTGVEMTFPLGQSAERDRRAALVAEAGLELIAIHGEVADADFKEHKRHFEDWLRHLAAANPVFITSQSGRDMFSFEENMEILDICNGVSRGTGIPIVQETHRSKLTFAAHLTARYLQARPEMRLTLDVSHWFNVHERYLEDLQEPLNLAISRTDHIHARVGFIEGPQVPDWRGEEWREVLDKHLAVWDGVVRLARSDGRRRVTVTPEYGPEPYALRHPVSGELLADPWEMNVAMKRMLEQRWQSW